MISRSELAQQLAVQVKLTTAALESVARVGAQGDEARAQAARLAEALQRSTDLAAEATKADYAMNVSEDPDTGMARKGMIQRAKAAWAAYDDCVQTALASTDARAWLNEQIAAELLRCADELQEPGKFESKEVQYLRKRAAALQQEAADAV